MNLTRVKLLGIAVLAAALVTPAAQVAAGAVAAQPTTVHVASATSGAGAGK